MILHPRGFAGDSNRPRCRRALLVAGTITIIAILLLPGCTAKKANEGRVPENSGTVASSSPGDSLSVTSEGVFDLQSYIVQHDVDIREVQIVDSTCMVELPPTFEEQSAAQADGTAEDFATGADDYDYYFAPVRSRVASLNLPIIQAKKRYLRFWMGENVTMLIDTKSYGTQSWNPILFKRGNVPAMLDLLGDHSTNVINEYFGVKHLD